MSNSSPTAPPTALRRLDTSGALELARLIAAFEELQTVLRCCERLVTELGRGGGEIDDVVVEAAWTLALLSYARSFAAGATTKPALTEKDVGAARPDSDVLTWHQLLLKLRAQHAHAVTNPRETFSVGVAQDAEGAASAVAITSVRQPLVDELTVRQTGAIAYALCGILDERINAAQATVFEEAKQFSPQQLERFSRVEVAPPDA